MFLEVPVQAALVKSVEPQSGTHVANVLVYESQGGVANVAMLDDVCQLMTLLGGGQSKHKGTHSQCGICVHTR